MVCKKCGAESVEGATYCGVCGSRVDGKKPCIACGKLNEEQFAYCVYCGTRMDGKKVCQKCGEAHNGEFCPYCGTPVHNVAPATTQTKKEQRPEGGAYALVKKIFGIASGASAMASVLFAVIFVFFIGITMSAELAEEYSLNGSASIFYYFGKAYRDVKDLGDSLSNMRPWFQNLITTDMTLFNVFGTVIGVLSLVLVLTFAALATIVYVKGWLGKTDKKPDKWIAACIVSFIAGASLFYALHYVSTNDGNVTGLMRTEMNGATKAGITFCCIFIGLAIVCKIVAAGKEVLQKQTLTKLICSLAGTTFAGILIGVARSSAFQMDTLVQNLGTGFLMSNVVWDIAYGSMWTTATTNYVEMTNALSSMNLFNIISQSLLLLVIVFAVLGLYGNLKNLISEKNGSGLVWSICALVCSVGLLVMNLLAYGRFEAILDYGDIAGTMTNPIGAIVCLIFAVFNLGASIVHTVMKKVMADK